MTSSGAENLWKTGDGGLEEAVRSKETPSTLRPQGEAVGGQGKEAVCLGHWGLQQSKRGGVFRNDWPEIQESALFEDKGVAGDGPGFQGHSEGFRKKELGREEIAAGNKASPRSFPGSGAWPCPARPAEGAQCIA